MKKLLSNIKDWITRHKVASIIIGVLLLTVIIGPIAEEQEKDEQAKVEQNEKETTQSEEKETESKPEETEEIKQPKKEEVSQDFKDKTEGYMAALSETYTTVGELTEAETESEMNAILQKGQMQFDNNRVYYNQLKPENSKEEALYEKVSKVDGLTARALMNAQDGLDRYDVDTINSATEDIEKASSLIGDIMIEIE